MSAFRSNLNSINNNVLRFARHNDAHSDDALEILLTNIYTAVPAAIIVESGVNYRTSTTDFQAWAIYYNPEQIFDPAAPNLLEVISQVANENNFAYTGTYEIYDENDLSSAPNPGNYLCLTSVDYEAPGVFPVLIAGDPQAYISDVIESIFVNNTQNGAVIGSFTIVYEVAGVFKITTFSSNVNAIINQQTAIPTSDLVSVFDPALSMTITGDPIPPHTTTGRYGILLNQYNTNYPL